MNRTLFSVFTILLLLVVAVAVMYQVYSADPYRVMGSSEVKEFSEEAIRAGGPQLCGELKKSFGSFDSEESLKAECVKYVSVGLKDATACGSISHQAWKDQCYTAVAVATKNEVICSKVETHPNQCYSYLAVLRNDIAVCGQVADQNEKELCYATSVETFPDIAVCENTIKKPANKDICYYKYAVSTQNSKICSRITEQDMEKDCLALTAAGVHD